MPRVTAATKDEATAALDRSIVQHCAVAFACDCRLAARVTAGGDAGAVYFYDFEFIVLSPGEYPARDGGWTIYENRGGVAVGRSR